MPAAVLTENLSKVYVKRRSLREIVMHPVTRAERVTGLDAVNLEVRQGEVFGLLGPNGAGKTTLLKILSCLVLPARGRALVHGATVAGDEARVKRSIGFMTSDERSFYWRLTGLENLRFFGRLYGLDAAGARSRSDELIDTMELGEVAGRQFMSYSSGMKQRMAIARALLHDPPVLCLDEPTRSLDPIAAKHLRRFVSERLNRGGGKTILLATHNLQEAEEMCGRLAVLGRGRVLRYGSLRDITAGLPGRDEYVLEVRGVERLPDDPRWTASLAREDGVVARIDASVDRGGEALTDFMRALLAARGTIVSCTRKETGLQEIFDQMDADASREGA